MNDPATGDLSNLSMLELFRVETETQAAILTEGLLQLERRNSTPAQLEALMRAAHSLKGAARIVNFTLAVQIAHAMEDCFVAAQQGRLQLHQEQTDVLLHGVDLLVDLARRGEAAPGGTSSNKAEPDLEDQDSDKTRKFLDAVAAFNPVLPASEKPAETDGKKDRNDSALRLLTRSEAQPTEATQTAGEKADRVLRLTADNLNRLLALAGESLVESRWLRPFSDSMQRLKRMHAELERTLENFRQSAEGDGLSDTTRSRFYEMFHQIAEVRQVFGERLEELDLYDRRSAHLSNRLYLEVLRARMRPFADGVGHFPRMVRDLARSLGKQVKLEIVGENTQVDRDILERLEAPLNHLLRNAVDHGCEMPTERQRAGKPPEATVRLEARHSAGMLLISVSDDGAGVDPARVRRLIVDRQLTTPALAEKMNESELLQFLFLPGFTLRDTVTEISGRGVGLDIVQDMVKSVRGNVRVSDEPGHGMRFHLQLPLTMSVLRTLLVEVGGAPYAIPLAHIVSTLKISRDEIETLEGRQHFKFGEDRIGLLSAQQVLDCASDDGLTSPGNELPIVLLADHHPAQSFLAWPEKAAEGDHQKSVLRGHGLLVDRFLGERELVVQPLDPRLGKVQDISAAALMEDGSPVLIVDVDDLLCSIEKLIATGSLAKLDRAFLESYRPKRKRVLAVDDSLTVRELERKLLLSRGYDAEVAVDGIDGWNAVRTGTYDLVITDVDMPRMDGIELASLIKRDPQLKRVPVLIVSYKDRAEDRLRGLEAGADYYLTKGSFQDETLLQAVQDLIGEPDS